MKKLIMGLLAFVFCIGCAVAPKPTSLPSPEKYKVEIVNKTGDILLGLLCLTKFPPKGKEKCLYGNVVLFPEAYALKDPKLPCKLVTHLEKGTYIAFFVGKDLRTEKFLGYTRMVFDVIKSDEFVIRDRSTNVKGVNRSYDI